MFENLSDRLNGAFARLLEAHVYLRRGYLPVLAVRAPSGTGVPQRTFRGSGATAACAGRYSRRVRETRLAARFAMIHRRTVLISHADNAKQPKPGTGVSHPRLFVGDHRRSLHDACGARVRHAQRRGRTGHC